MVWSDSKPNANVSLVHPTLWPWNLGEQRFIWLSTVLDLSPAQSLFFPGTAFSHS